MTAAHMAADPEARLVDPPQINAALQDVEEALDKLRLPSGQPPGSL